MIRPNIWTDNLLLLGKSWFAPSSTFSQLEFETITSQDDHCQSQPPVLVSNQIKGSYVTVTV